MVCDSKCMPVWQRQNHRDKKMGGCQRPRGRRGWGGGEEGVDKQSTDPHQARSRSYANFPNRCPGQKFKLVTMRWDLTLALPQTPRLPCCSHTFCFSHISSTCSPQGLCTCCSLCQKYYPQICPVSGNIRIQIQLVWL